MTEYMYPNEETRAAFDGAPDWAIIAIDNGICVSFFESWKYDQRGRIKPSSSDSVYEGVAHVHDYVFRGLKVFVRKPVGESKFY